MRQFTVVHTTSTTRHALVAVPDDVSDEDIEQYLYENLEENEGDIAAGRWQIDDYILEAQP